MALGVKTGGRQKGTPNKVTGALKDMILGALDDAGGREYLVRQAEQNPTAFMTLVGKVLPMQTEHSGPDGGAIEVADVSDIEAARRVAFLLTKAAKAKD